MTNISAANLSGTVNRLFTNLQYFEAMFELGRYDNIISFPALRRSEATCPNVPKVVRDLTPDELKGLSSLDKAMVGLVFSIRNLASGKIDVLHAERNVQNIISILKKRFESED